MSEIKVIFLTLPILFAIGCHSIEGIKNDNGSFLENFKKDLQKVSDIITQKPADRNQSRENTSQEKEITKISQRKEKVSEEQTEVISQKVNKIPHSDSNENIATKAVPSTFNNEDDEEIVIIRAK